MSHSNELLANDLGDLRDPSAAESNDPPRDTTIHDSVVRLQSIGGGIGAEVRIGVHVDVGGRRSTSQPFETDSGPRAELGAGSVVAGRYELVRLIGRGSMGTVWLANHRALDEEVAVKLLAPAYDTAGIENASTTAARFRFEARVAARLSRRSRHVVRVSDHGHDGARAFLVMERLQGQTLERALLTRGPMPPREVATLVSQIARGLEVAHADGVLHRDLKPSNVFLTQDEDGETLVKILDFGIARRHRSPVDTRFVTAQGVLFGTPGYMSPEQASASPDLDARADVWSLAAIAYEALTGELPVNGPNTNEILANLRAGNIIPVRERNAALSEACGRFFDRAFAPRIDDRHATCTELAADFERAAAPTGRGHTLAARTVRIATAIATASGSRRPALLTASRRRTLAVALAVAALAVVVACCAFGSRPRFALGAGPALAATVTEHVAGSFDPEPRDVPRPPPPTVVAAALSTASSSTASSPSTLPAAPPLELEAQAKHPAPSPYGEFKTYF